MAPPRPYWKGYLKLSLVSCPIAVYPATSTSERVAFKQINKQTGNRLRQQLVDEETGDVVEAADKGRGYEVSKHEYMMVEDDELEAIAIETNQTVEIDSFVPRAQIDERFLDSPYYLVPDNRVGQDAFAVIREAMRGKEMVAIGRIVLAKRERVMMLRPWEKGLIGTTLRYASEVRDTAAYFGELPDIAVPADMLQLAEHILASKAADFEPAQFRDRYEDAVVAMLKAKQAGRTPSTEAPRFAGRKIVDLMEALRRSLAATPKPGRGDQAEGQKGGCKGAGQAHRPGRDAAADRRDQGCGDASGSEDEAYKPEGRLRMLSRRPATTIDHRGSRSRYAIDVGTPALTVIDFIFFCLFLQTPTKGSIQRHRSRLRG